MDGEIVNSQFNPFADHTTAGSAVAVVARADAMGLLPTDPYPPASLDSKAFEMFLANVESLGIARMIVAGIRSSIKLGHSLDVESLRDQFTEFNEVLEDSPVPTREWASARRYFDNEQLACLLRVSPASVNRYISNERKTPDTVAARLHWLMLVVGDLLGSYNDLGVRRWFERSRTALGRMSPKDVLTGIPNGWNPDDEEIIQVRELARALTASSAT